MREGTNCADGHASGPHVCCRPPLAPRLPHFPSLMLLPRPSPAAAPPPPAAHAAGLSRPGRACERDGRGRSGAVGQAGGCSSRGAHRAAVQERCTASEPTTQLACSLPGPGLANDTPCRHSATRESATPPTKTPRQHANRHARQQARHSRRSAQQAQRASSHLFCSRSWSPNSVKNVRSVISFDTRNRSRHCWNRRWKVTPPAQVGREGRQTRGLQVRSARGGKRRGKVTPAAGGGRAGKVRRHEHAASGSSCSRRQRMQQLQACMRPAKPDGSNGLTA